MRSRPLGLAFGLLAALTVSPAVADDAPGLTALLESYRAPRPAQQAFAAAGKTVSIGHLEIKLDEGVVVPLQGGDGSVLGVYFEGQGHYFLRSADPSDRQVLETNVKRYAGKLDVREFTVRDFFRRAVVLFAQPEFQALWDPAAGAGATAAPPAAGGFDKLWAGIQKSYLEFDHLAVEALFNGAPRQYVYAEFDGGENIGYVFDRVRTYEERLFTFRKFQGYDLRFEERLSLQPIEAQRPASIVPRHVAIDLATEDNRSATIDTTLDLEVGAENLRVVALGLTNNRDPAHYDWASGKNALRVRSVTAEGGRELVFSHRYHEILVQLPESVPRGAKLRLRFETAGEILTDMNNTRTDVYFVLMSDYWFPQPMGWDFCCFTFDIKMRTKKPYRPATSGIQIAFREDGEFYELESRCDRRTSRIAVFAGKYKTQEERFDNLTVRLHAYAMARKNVLENMPKLATAMVRFFEQQLGPYPFEELDIVEIPEYGFGIAPSGMVLLTTEAYKPYQDFLATYLSRGINARLAHEIAHQWFGHKIVPSESRENWLAESFAEYFSGLLMGAFDPKENRIVDFKRMLSEWQAEAKLCRDAPLDAANILGGEEGWRDRYCLLYNRGPLVLHMFRTMVGHERFIEIVKRFLDYANMGPATTEDLGRIASEVTKFDLTWFFKQWHEQAGVPEIKVEHRAEQAGGGYVLAGRVQQQAAGFKKMVIPLVVDYSGGKREVKLVIQEQPVQDFRIPIASWPAGVSVDPSQNNLAVYR